MSTPHLYIEVSSIMLAVVVSHLLYGFFFSLPPSPPIQCWSVVLWPHQFFYINIVCGGEGGVADAWRGGVNLSFVGGGWPQAF